MTDKEKVELSQIKERVKNNYALTWHTPGETADTLLGTYNIRSNEQDPVTLFEVYLGDRRICVRPGCIGDAVKFVEEHYAAAQAQADCACLLALIGG